jgi:hypothetical protein
MVAKRDERARDDERAQRADGDSEGYAAVSGITGTTP